MDTSPVHTDKAFDPVIHPLNRLQICAALAPHSEMEFSALRDVLGVSDSVLSKQLRYLEEAGYARLRKATVNTRQRTWIRLTDAGRKAYAGHLAALRNLAGL